MPSLLLRIGLALVFLYAAVGSFLEPLNWVGYFPAWLRAIVPQQVLLGGFSLFEAGVALWLLSGRQVFFASLVAAAALLGIVLANFRLFDIVFRDLGLFFSALALALLSRSSLDRDRPSRV